MLLAPSCRDHHEGFRIADLAAIANQGKDDSMQRYRSSRDLHSPLDRLHRGTSHCASQIPIPLAGRRNPARCSLFFLWRRQFLDRTRTASARPDPCRDLRHRCHGYLRERKSRRRHPAHSELNQSKNNTTLLREPCLPATDRSLLAFNLRASLLDASLDQLGFHFFLLPGKKRHFGFKCPIARQRDFDLMLSRTHR